MGKIAKPITIYEGLKRYYAGQDILMTVSVTGDFNGRHPVDAHMYLKHLLNPNYMQFYEEVDEEVETPELIIFDEIDEEEDEQAFKDKLSREIGKIMRGEYRNE